MPEGSDEATIEEELAELKGESSSSTDADLAELEAELEAESGAEDVGLDSDPSEQYADLLDDAPSGGGSRGGSGEGATDGSSGGFLDDLRGSIGGLFGGDEGSAASVETESATGPGLDDEPTSVDDLLRDRDTSGDEATETADSDGIRARIAAYFSPRAFLAAAVAMVLFGGVGRTFVPLVGGPVGLAAGAFLVGLVDDDRRYLEVLVAGALLGALASVAGAVTVAFATGTITRIAAVGGGGGLLAALVGYYFGRDLRGGLVGGSSSAEWEEREL